jgi:hypothetical protein
MCGKTPTALFDTPRRTLDRGPDPDDSSYSIIVILPDVPLCEQHARRVRDGSLHLGWCDDPRCREYGEADELCACGARYDALVSGKRPASGSKKR